MSVVVWIYILIRPSDAQTTSTEDPSCLIQRSPQIAVYKQLPSSSAFAVGSEGDIREMSREIQDLKFGNKRDFYHQTFANNVQGSAISQNREQTNMVQVWHQKKTSFKDGLWFGAMVCGCMISLVAITALLCMRWASEDRDSDNNPPARRAIQASAMGYIFLFTMSVTAIIPEAYGLMLTEGKGPTASGWLIGSPWAFCAFSSLCMRPLVAADCWSQSRNRLIVLGSYAFMASAVLVFALAADYSTLLGKRRFFLLVTSRITMGLADGPNLILTVMTWKITPRTEMVQYEIFRVCCKCAGIGMGPILSSLVSLISGANGAAARSAHTSYVIAACWIFFGLATWQNFPLDLAQLIEAKEVEESRCSENERHTQEAASSLAIEAIPEQARKRIWLSAVMYGTERTFIVSGLEAGTALVLETEFHWDTKYVGLAIGLTFLGGLPLAVAANAVQRPDFILSAKLMCVAAALSVVFATLLFPDIGRFFNNLSEDNAVGVILLADSVIFTAGYLANGIIDAFAVRSSLPGTAFSIENLKLIDSVVQNSLARFIAPPIVRWCLEKYGRAFYAGGQLTISVLGLFSCFSAARILLQCNTSGINTNTSDRSADGTSPYSAVANEGTSSTTRKAREDSRPGWRSPQYSERIISVS